MSDQTVWVLDAESRRKAAIVHLLLQRKIHAEPVESVEEFIDAAPKNLSAILTYDDENIISFLLKKLAEMRPFCPVIAYNEQPAIGRVVEAIRGGIDHYLHWPFEALEVVNAINASALSGPRSLRNIRSRAIAARVRLQRLTPREREVLAGVVNGLSNRGVAEVLNISPRTVEIHRGNLMRKINARHTAEAMRLAIEADFVE